MRQCKDKGHISHPQEKPQATSTGGRGARGSRWVHYIGGAGGGGACQTWIIYIYIYTCRIQRLAHSFGIWPGGRVARGTTMAFSTTHAGAVDGAGYHLLHLASGVLVELFFKKSWLGLYHDIGKP